MSPKRVLVVGGGIGGLTLSIALRRRGMEVVLVERDPSWSVYGVGIIQQSNVIRAMKQLDLLDDYIDAGFGFDDVEIYDPMGVRVARIPSPKLVQGYPANVGIGRRALQRVLVDRARALGTEVRLGVEVTALEDGAGAVDVRFSDGNADRFDIAVGADGLYSATRSMLFPELAGPEFTGQSVWRYNFPRPEDLDALSSYIGPVGVGLVPLSRSLMYMFATTAEPGNPRYPRQGLAEAMRGKLAGCAPAIRALGAEILVDDEVVYKPLEVLFVEGPWHRGRTVLLGDAVHATTPHMGQGAGMAIEGAIVLADELARTDDPERAFTSYRARRADRARYVVDASLAICRGQLGQGPSVDLARATQEMFHALSEPI